MTIDFEASAPSLPTEKELKEVSSLVKKQIRLENAIAAGEKSIEEMKSELLFLSSNQIPMALAEFNLTTLGMTDGSTVTVRPLVKGSIRKDDELEVFDSLREMGHGDLIKRVVSVAFGAGEDKMADELKAELVKRKLSSDDKATIHHGTLNSFVKEQTAEGNMLPPKLNVFHGFQTKIERPKK